MTRDDFTVAVQRVMSSRVGHMCSNPDCRALTSGPIKDDPQSKQSSGVAAHITAAAPGGPRYDPSLSAQDRRSLDNGIWLCQSCSRFIDNDGGQDYAVEVLRSWKKVAEARAHEVFRLQQQAVKPEWMSRLSQIHFVNVPRVLADGSLTSPLLLEFEQTGFPEGSILPLLRESARLISGWDFRAVDPAVISDMSSLVPGARVAFQGSCRTKYSEVRYQDLGSTPLREWPQVYKEFSGWKFIFPYDPRFVTTTTAGVTLRGSGGQANLAVLGEVRSADDLRQEVICLTYVLAQPKFGWDLW